ncbi:MAG: TetR/AcrR family transcriptional regulator [Lachnospiraceae bacterium]|nr:TetR/AcrR family transcriptional regulator [Lachnospiraceae bacterium]
MRRNTRQNILDAARKLFNEYGYNSVSLRDIANDAGISKGNLTYHFSKKEEIMEALISEGKDTFPSGIPGTLEELDEAFLDMQRAVQQNLYFFLYHAQLAQTSPKICQKQSARYEEVQKKFQTAFHLLHSAGLLRDESFPGEYSHIIDLLHMSAIYWAPFSELKKSVHTDPSEYRRHAWRTMHPLLTEKGRIHFYEAVL